MKTHSKGTLRYTTRKAKPLPSVKGKRAKRLRVVHRQKHATDLLRRNVFTDPIRNLYDIVENQNSQLNKKYSFTGKTNFNSKSEIFRHASASSLFASKWEANINLSRLGGREGFPESIQNQVQN